MPTQSGNPEVTINKVPSDRVRNALVLCMSSIGATTIQEGPTSLSFEQPMQGSGAVAYQLLLGSVYSSAPMQRVTFSIIPIAGGTKVYGFIKFTMNNGFGGNQDTDVTRGRAGTQLYELLLKFKTALEQTKGGRA
jgi:hypothetical protein